MFLSLKENRGITLIELLIALVISSVLVGAAYRAFVGQQKTYTAQEQVVDLQQNVRISVSKMMDEIMMAGFGGVTRYLTSGGIDGANNVITPTSAHVMTIVGGGVTPFLATDDGAAITVTAMNGNIITLNKSSHGIATGKFICVGADSFNVTAVNGSNLTLDRTPFVNVTGNTVYQVIPVTYDVNASGPKPYLERNGQNIADNVESVEFKYLDGNGNEIASPVDPDQIRIVKVTLTARTEMQDPDYKGGDGGFRRRTITSNIKVRNIGLGLSGTGTFQGDRPISP